MEDITLKSNLRTALSPGLDAVAKTSPSSRVDGDHPSFADTLNQSIEKVNSLQKEADQAIEQLSAGDSQSIHGAMLAVGKADLAFRMTMQVRNKIVEAYQEVMRMQI